MKKFLLLGVTCLFGLQVVAQSTHTYGFNGNMMENAAAGPVLNPIGTGTYLQENLPDYNINQKVYQFDNNCGFSYDDAAGFIAAGNYTIELYFKMSSLSSWKRVIDFKNRTTDKGCYVLNGQMNFYNIATSSGTPFLQDEYSHYVITRDAASKTVTMYGDGNHYIQFTDANDDAVYDATERKLSFFHDDLIVPNESSAGAIALLKIHNYAMDSNSVRASFNNLSGTLGISNIKKASIAASLFPNPSQHDLHIQLPLKAAVAYDYYVIDAVGKTISKGILKGGDNTLPVASFTPGIYHVVIRDTDGNTVNKSFVKN